MATVELTKHELTIKFRADEGELYPTYSIKCLGEKEDRNRNCYTETEEKLHNCNLEWHANDGYLPEVSMFHEDKTFKVTVHADNVGNSEEPVWSLLEVDR